MLEELSVGDKIRVLLKDGRIFEGYYIPRPELLERDVLILKLDNGYNIGIKLDKIEKIELIERYKKEEVERKKEQHISKDKEKVGMIVVGGTIASKVDYRTGGVHPLFDISEILEVIPEIEDICVLDIEVRRPLKVSEDFTPDDWIDIAKRVYNKAKSSSGVLILHGTDTMHYTSAALSFFLRLNVPVLLIGSQRSSDRGSSDAYTNIIAGCWAATKWDGAEVCICMHATTEDKYNYILRGTRVRKMHTSRRDAFQPIGIPPLAKVYYNGRIEVVWDNYRRRGEVDEEIDTKIDKKVFLLKFFPGMPTEIFDWILEMDYHGLVIEGTGLGHISGWMADSVRKLVKEGIPVIVTSQTLYGRTHPYVYTNLRKLSLYAGALHAEDMLPETAYVKLMWVLGHTKDIEEVYRMMLTNYAGEITERSWVGGFIS